MLILRVLKCGVICMKCDYYNICIYVYGFTTFKMVELLFTLHFRGWAIK